MGWKDNIAFPILAEFGTILLSIKLSPGKETRTMKGYTILIVAILFCLLLAGGCSEESTTGIPRPVPIEQGLMGQVRFWEGNFHPTIPPGSSTGQIRPVRREIRVHRHQGSANSLGPAQRARVSPAHTPGRKERGKTLPVRKNPTPPLS